MARNKTRISGTELLRALRRLIRRAEPEHPDDPYALVGAPKKPRPPLRDSAVAVHPDDEY